MADPQQQQGQAAPPPPPVYLDDNGLPIKSPTQIVSHQDHPPAPAQLPVPKAGYYLDDQGNPTNQPVVGAPIVNPAARPGAYQQSKGGKIRNAVDEAANPFSDSVTSILPKSLGGQTGALMQRDDENYSQFIARAVEAGKHVTQEQIDAEHAQNKKGVLPTLVAAAAAGPLQLGAEAGLAEGGAAATTGARVVSAAAQRAIPVVHTALMKPTALFPFPGGGYVQLLHEVGLLGVAGKWLSKASKLAP